MFKNCAICFVKLTIIFIFTVTLRDCNALENTSISIDYRLPQTIRPDSYEISLKLNKDFATTNEFQGVVTIYITVLKATNEIKLHSKNLRIQSASVYSINSRTNLTGDHLISDNQTDILTIPTNQILTENQYEVTIIFNGSLNLIDMHGFYKSSYLDNDKIEYLVATQFESTYARRAFPCFDEPQLKATFQLQITYPYGYKAFSNTPISSESTIIDLVTTNFQKTPKMSTYLLAFVVSKFTCLSGTIENGTLPLRVCSRPETEHLRDIAFDYGAKVLNYLQTFTGSNFSDFLINKLDQIAIPDFAPGAMENWGLVTYKEVALLSDPDETSNNFKQRTLMIIAHELAHNWFGNWVTLKWWSDTFVNEGFARLFQYYAADAVERTWQIDLQFIIEQFQTALAIDAVNNSKALSSHVATFDEISERFGTISYNKGACILRMVAHILGEEQFQKGLQNYIQRFKFGNVDANDLWTALNEVANISNHLSLTTVMHNWTNEPGYPIIKVEVHGKDITLSQSQFLYSGETKRKWYVPVTYTRANDKEKFVDTTPQVWLLPTQESFTVQNCLDDDHSWIILNNQQTGYYRVDYDETLWKRISSALQHENFFNDITPLTRSQIIDDLFNFARAGRKTYSEIFDIIEFLRRDTDYYSWYSAFRGFAFLFGKIENSRIRENLNELIMYWMSDLYRSVPFEDEYPDGHIYTFKQVLTLDWARKVGIRDVIAKSKQLFSKYQQEKTISLSPNLRGVIYCTALQNSNNATNDWSFLWNNYQKTSIPSEKITILATLGCVQDTQVLKNYLDEIFNENSKIRRQDTATALSSIFTNNPDGSLLIFDYIIENYSKVLKFYQLEDSIVSLIKTLIDRFRTSDQIDKVNRFLKTDVLSSQGKTVLETAVDQVKDNLKWIEKVEFDLDEYFESHGNTATVTTFTGLVLLSSLLFSILL